MFYKLKFESIEKSLKQFVKGWSCRGLMPIVKVPSIKLFALPKVLYKLMLISSNTEFIKNHIVRRHGRGKTCSFDLLFIHAYFSRSIHLQLQRLFESTSFGFVVQYSAFSQVSFS